MDDLQRHSEIITVHDDNNSQRPEKKQIIGSNLGVGIIYLDRYPMRFYGFEAKIGIRTLNQVESPEYLNVNAYYVDWDNGFVQFDIKNIKQIVDVKYYGNTYTRISANRIYTVLDEQGNVLETIDGFIEGQRKKVDDKITEFNANEDIRKTNESTRISTENTRNTSESQRKLVETTRENSESTRKTNENIRISNEDTRKSNEVIRITNEDLRKQGYTTMDNRIDNLVLGQGSVTEVIDAHFDSVTNKIYPTLKARLDAASKQLFDSSLATLTTSDLITSLENATDGLMQIDSIKGRTLQNIIANSDFSKGASNWVGESGSTLSADKNIGIVTGNGSTKHLGIAQFLNPSFFVPTNKIYSRMLVRTTDAGIDVKPEILMQLRDASIITVDKISNASQNTWYSLSGISSIVGQEAPYLRAIIFYASNEQQKNRVLEIKEILTVDLTQMFGVGQEPTKEWCDANLSYFDGIKSTGEEFSDVNLFDKSKATLNAIINKTGEVVSAPDYYCSDFISVKEGYKVRFKDSSADNGSGLAFYKDKNFVSWISNANLYKMGLIVTIPIGVNSLRSCSYRTPITIDNYTINQEEYKIEIVSQGKNLFDKEKVVSGTLNPNGTVTGNDPAYSISNFIAIELGADYFIGARGSTVGNLYDLNKMPLQNTSYDFSFNNSKFQVDNPKVAYIRFRIDNTFLNTLQIKKGILSTPYEPYVEDKSEILLKEPLRGLLNGVSDEIVGDKVYKRVGKPILNGSEHCDYINAYGTVARFDIILTNSKPSGKCLSDKFQVGAIGTNNLECINIHGVSGRLQLQILKTNLIPHGFVEGNAPTYITSFKKWLSENPTEVYYELAEPITTTINPTSLKCFKDGSIILNNVITPIVSLKYPTSIGGRLASVESTLDDTVDRTKKLEEGLLTTVTQVIDNKNKIEGLEGDNTTNKLNVLNNKTDADKTKAEVENARKGKANLRTKIDEIDTNIGNMQLEITNARNGKTDLKTEIDGIKINVKSLQDDNAINKTKITNLETAVNQVIPVAPTRLRIATWNINSGGDSSDVYKDLYLQSRRELIKQYNIHVCALQEVDLVTERTSKINQLEVLSGGIFTFRNFHKNLNHQGGEFGQAIASKFDFIRVNKVNFTAQNPKVPDVYRGYSMAVIIVNGVEYKIFNTHLDWENLSVRTSQLAQLKASADAESGKKIIVGDLNIQSLAELDVFHGKGYTVLNRSLDTYNKNNDGYKILDNIIASTNVAIDGTAKVISTLESDHCPLYVDLIV